MPSQHTSLVAASPSGSSTSSPDNGLIVKERQPLTRRGHSKSRLGCFNCKRRRVKCDEHRPSCAPCCRLGLRCQYPPRGYQASAEPRPPPMSLALEDLRFHYQFLTVAYPSLPLQGGDIWSQCGAMTHSYDFLAHAALGLGASHLSQNGNVSYTAQALQHRVTAIRLINEQLADPLNKSLADADALFAALVCIIAQSSLMEDGMTDYLVMTRGANLVSSSIIPDYSRSIFSSFTPEGHIESLRRMITDQPKDVQVIEGFLSSVKALEPLCLKIHEKQYLESLIRSISLLPESSFAAWEEFVNLWIMPSLLKNEDFLSFVDLRNHIGQLLIIHMFLLDYILGRSCIAPEDEPKCPGRKNIIIVWTGNIVRRLPNEYQQFASWLKLYCVVLARQDARYLLSP